MRLRHRPSLLTLYALVILSFYAEIIHAEDKYTPVVSPTPLVFENEENNLKFVILRDNQEVIFDGIRINKSGLYTTGESYELLFGIRNVGNILHISNDGNYFVATEAVEYEDIIPDTKNNIEAINYLDEFRRNGVSNLNFFQENNLVRKYHIQNLVHDPDKITLSIEHLEFRWINKTKFNTVTEEMYLETVDNLLYVFNIKTGEITGTKLDDNKNVYPELTASQMEYYVSGESAKNWKTVSEKKYIFIDYNKFIDAARNGNNEALKQMLEQGADPNYITKDEKIALDVASINGRYETVEILIEHGVDTKQAYKPLLYAIGRKHFDVAKLLIESGTPVNSTEYTQSAPLDAILRHYYSEKNEKVEEFLIYLLNNGADVNFTNAYTTPRIFFAVQKNELSLVKLFITYGADLGFKDGSNNMSLLHYVQSEEMIDLLVKEGMDINTKDTSGQTALYLMIKQHNKNAGLIKALLKHDANINIIPSKHEYSLFAKSIKNRNAELVKLFIEYGSDVNSTQLNGEKPLHIAVGSGPTEIVKIILDAGADINAENKHGMTALDLLCRSTLGVVPVPGPGITQERIDGFYKRLENMKNTRDLLIQNGGIVKSLDHVCGTDHFVQARDPDH